MATQKIELISTSGIGRLRNFPAANGAIVPLENARQRNPGLIPGDATHWSFNKDLVVRFYKKETEQAAIKRDFEEKKSEFVRLTRELINFVGTKAKPYADYDPETRAQFDSRVEYLYRSLWFPLVQAQTATAQKVADRPAFPKEEMDSVAGLYYQFRGRPEPEPGLFDKVMTKIGTTFGVAVVGFITAGVGAAAIGTAAPTAASAGLGAVKGLTGVDVGKIQDNLQGSVADKIQAAQAKAADVIANAPGALADNAINKALASKSEAIQMPIVNNVTESEMANAAKNQSVSMAGFGSLAIGLLVVSVLLSKKRN